LKVQYKVKKRFAQEKKVCSYPTSFTLSLFLGLAVLRKDPFKGCPWVTRPPFCPGERLPPEEITRIDEGGGVRGKKLGERETKLVRVNMSEDSCGRAPGTEIRQC